jgi:hypothetical protein
MTRIRWPSGDFVHGAYRVARLLEPRLQIEEIRTHSSDDGEHRDQGEQDQQGSA